MEYKYKKVVNYTVDKETVKEFNKICKEKSINKSALIDALIKKWIKVVNFTKENIRDKK